MIQEFLVIEMLEFSVKGNYDLGMSLALKFAKWIWLLVMIIGVENVKLSVWNWFAVSWRIALKWKLALECNYFNRVITLGNEITSRESLAPREILERNKQQCNFDIFSIHNKLLYVILFKIPSFN